MDDIDKMMLNGTLCHCCGASMIGGEKKPSGYPVLCDKCELDVDEDTKQKVGKR